MSLIKTMFILLGLFCVV